MVTKIMLEHSLQLVATDHTKKYFSQTCDHFKDKLNHLKIDGFVV